MLIKNISGKDSYFAIGIRSGLGSRNVRGKFIANNGTANFPDDNAKVLSDARRYEVEGKIQILSGPEQTADSGSVQVPATATIEITDTGTSAGNFVTINGVAFEWNTSAGAVTAGRVWAGAAAAGVTAVGTLRTAVNAHATVGVKAGSTIDDGTDNILPLVASAGADVTVGANYALLKTGAQIAVSASTFKGGIRGNAKRVSEFSYTVTAADVDDETFIIPTGLVEVGAFTVQARTATGVLRDISSTTPPKFTIDTVVKGNLIVDDTAGNLLASGDKIWVRAVGL